MPREREACPAGDMGRVVWGLLQERGGEPTAQGITASCSQVRRGLSARCGASSRWPGGRALPGRRSEAAGPSAGLLALAVWDGAGLLRL